MSFLRLSLLSGLCIILCGQDVHAQFWKKWFEEDRPVRKKAVMQPTTPRTQARPPAPKSTAKPGTNKLNANAAASTSATPDRKKKEEKKSERESVFKDRYRIDVLGQVYLNDLFAGNKPVYKSHIPDKSIPGLNFYQGIRLAADTLNVNGYQIDVYFHDISDPANSVANLISRKKLDSTDLIIGAVPSAEVGPLAAFAKSHKINFVSALSPSDGNVLNNPNFHLLQPTLERHCEALRETISKKVGRRTVLVYHRCAVSLDDESFKLLTQDDPFNFDTVNCDRLPGVDTLRAFLDSTQINYVVMPILQASYAKQLLTQLHQKFPQYIFEVYGMPSWKGMDVLRKEGSIENIGITVTAPFYFDPSTSAGQRFAETYNRVYGGKPGELAFRGYETLYWYAYLLLRYGSRFNDHYADSGPAPFTRFDVKLQKDEDGKVEYYENSHVYQYRYQGGSFSVEQ